MSAYEQGARKVTITRVGEPVPFAVVDREAGGDNIWTAVAPGGVAVAWKEDQQTVVRSLPDGEAVARVKSGWGYDLRFSPGGRWLTEKGDRVFRVFDRTGKYRKFARITTPRFSLTEVTDGLTAAVTAEPGTVAVWDLSSKSATAILPAGGNVSALAISADGRRVLTGNTDGEVTLWDAAGAPCSGTTGG